MRRASLVLANFLFCLVCAHAQKDLLGKLVKGDDQSRTPVKNASVSLDEDGSHDLTNDTGLFRLFLSDALKPGVEVTITVAVPGYAIYDPPGGKLIVPADHIHRREIQLLPKGSPKFLSDAQLKALMEHTANESNRISAQENSRQPPDLKRYLKDWAVEYGFTDEQVEAEIRRWATDVDSRKSNTYDLALAAFAFKNFIEANEQAMEAAKEDEDRKVSLHKQEEEANDSSIRDYRLAGNAAYNALDFEKASDAYQRALINFSNSARGAEWASIQVQLGNAEGELISRSEGTAISRHGKSALTAYSDALTIYSRKDFPKPWAVIQIDQGNALHELAARSEGAQASLYLQKAEEAFRGSLQIFDPVQTPQAWATAQNNLGSVLHDLSSRSEGVQASCYLQQAIDSYRDALRVRTREQLPEEWATTQMNLGNALTDRGRSGGVLAAFDLTQAVEAYQLVLQAGMPGQQPSEGWALVQNNLGAALYNLAFYSEGTEACSDLQKAVDAYGNALQVRTHEQLPQDWAATKNNLGAAFRGLAKCNKGPVHREYLQKAVDAYQGALQVRTREQLPQGWATTQFNLGNLFRELASQTGGTEASQYLLDAIGAYRSALQIYSETTFPTRWTEVTGALASVYEAEADWTDAYTCYQQLLRHDPDDPSLQIKIKQLSERVNQKP
jgi:tetratricopeptide (TPR) repeat protein